MNEPQYFTPEVRCYSDGRVERTYIHDCRYGKKGIWYPVKPTPSANGYCVIGIGRKPNKKHYRVHRIIAFCFGILDEIEAVNDENDVDHRDGNKLNNAIENLRQVSDHENSFNRPTTKGYSWRKDLKKWQARIVLNKKHIHLGYFDTEEEAHQAYLAAKLIYHVIPERPINSQPVQ